MKTEKLLLAATLVLVLAPSMTAAQQGQTAAAPQPAQPAQPTVDPAAETSVSSLNNKDVLVMVEKKVETETIIKTIKSSPCTFDTFPPLLKEMKRRGVPETVLLAMLEAPYGPSVINSSRDDLGQQPIYHYAEQLKQMGFLNAVPSGRGLEPMRRGRTSLRGRSTEF